MTIRKKFVEKLKKVLDYSVNNNAITFTIWALFIITFIIIGRLRFKAEPIPLSDDEIKYYTSQAEIGCLKGLSYLDDNVELIPIDKTTFNVYSSDSSDYKQKLKVTFFNDTVLNTETYYSVNFEYLNFCYAFISFIVGFVVGLVFLLFMEYINIKIQDNSIPGCPLYFPDEDE